MDTQTHAPSVYVSLILYDSQERILVGEQTQDPFAGYWMFPQQPLSHGSTPRDCAHDIASSMLAQPPKIYEPLSFVSTIWDSHHHVTLFIMAACEDDATPHGYGGINEWQFTELDEIPSPLYPPVEHFINHLAEEMD